MTTQPISVAARTTTPGATIISVSLVVAYAILLATMLERGHAAGGEIWGLIATVVGLAASILTLVVLHSSRRAVRVAVVVLWMFVLSLGVTGTLDHAAPVLVEYLDQRPRPPLVPLVYAVFGMVGIWVVVANRRSQRRAGRLPREQEHEQEHE